MITRKKIIFSVWNYKFSAIFALKSTFIARMNDQIFSLMTKNGSICMDLIDRLLFILSMMRKTRVLQGTTMKEFPHEVRRFLFQRKDMSIVSFTVDSTLRIIKIASNAIYFQLEISYEGKT